MPEWGARGSRGGGKSRLRRTAHLAAPGRLAKVREGASHPAFVPVVLICALLTGLCAAVIGLSRGALLVAEGRILDESRVVRVEFQVRDDAATERDRGARSISIPRCYTADDAAIKELHTALRSLPSALAAAASLEEVAPELRASFGLDGGTFDLLRVIAASDRARTEWEDQVGRLMDLLMDRPLISAEELQLALSDPAQRLEVRLPGGLTRNLPESDAISAAGEHGVLFRELALRAGMAAELAPVVAARVSAAAKPLFIFDKTETDARRDRAAASAPPVMVTYRPGEVLARRGDILKPDQLALLKQENQTFKAAVPLHASLAQWIGVAGVAGLIASAFGIYVRLYYASIALVPMRFLGLVLLTTGGAAVACWATILQPGWLWASAVAPLLFTTMIAVIALESRLGLAMAAAQCALVGAALSLPLGYFAAVIAASGLAAWRLREVRSRNDVVRAAVVVGAGLALATIAVSLLSRPLVAQGAALWSEVLSDAVRAGAGGFLAGAMTLVVLPTVERLFDVTTGMTLSEWRDPKQPLLRKLQLQAPGTFNHSHTVATLAEAAAEAIGANGLHVYVGALYHDIGKMNKPDYFVENQPRGFNRHAKLSPAMSLLVIVGHVKDGVELAREYKLPRSLVGYIETHHGATLVEYFYDQARRQAEDEQDEPPPQEIEYRYPGPKPRTREQAILMICDAVESATRALPDPTPARIQSLVHTLATKRLMDGQFDECSLTLAELNKIEEAVSRTLASIYHGRIAYPAAATESRGSGGLGETRQGLAEQAG
ncbi:MAG: HDIG domain-containing protein [Planctomycetota bacterium]|nr:HDIG domain-containing protein [Planctomycetota bacterium]